MRGCAAAGPCRRRSRSATPAPAARGTRSPAPPIRLLTPSTRKLPSPRLPPSTEGTPTVSQRPRRRGAETAFEYGAWIFPSRGRRPGPGPALRPAVPLAAPPVPRGAPGPGPWSLRAGWSLGELLCAFMTGTRLTRSSGSGLGAIPVAWGRCPGGCSAFRDMTSPARGGVGVGSRVCPWVRVSRRALTLGAPAPRWGSGRVVVGRDLAASGGLWGWCWGAVWARGGGCWVFGSPWRFWRLGWVVVRSVGGGGGWGGGSRSQAAACASAIRSSSR